MALEIAIKQVDGIQIVSMNGTLTSGTTLLIAEARILHLIQSGEKRLVLDLSQVSHCDSGGLGMLVNAVGQMDHHGGRLRLAAAGDKLHRLFHLTHTDSIFHCDANVEDAIEALRGAGASA